MTKAHLLASRLRMIVLGLLLLVTSVYAWREIRRKMQPAVQSIAAVGGMNANTHFAEQPIYFQHDPRWGKDTIGGSAETMADVGCTVSSLSMALAHHGIEMSPGQLNQQLKEKGGYTKEGWLIWHKVFEVTGGRVEITLPDQPTYALMDQALTAGQPIVANITMNGTVLHWVLIVGKAGQEYLIKDPLGNGKLEKLSKFSSSVHAIRIVRKVHEQRGIK